MIDFAKLGKPPGLVGDLCAWLNETAGKPQPAYELAASLVYVGALAARYIQGPGGERTNLYAIGVGASCSGKEHARKKLKQVSLIAGVQKLFGGEDVTSDAAIEADLIRQDNRVLYMWDELGHMFGSVTASQNKGSHRAGIIPYLTKIYTSASERFEGKSYADPKRPRAVFDQPSVSMYGTTVPGRLYESLTKGQVADGWLGRVPVFESTDDPLYDRNRARVSDPPAHIIGQVQYWQSQRDTRADSGTDIIKATTIQPRVIEYTDEAGAVADRYAKYAHERKLQADESMRGLWGRAFENAARIALIVTAGCIADIDGNHGDKVTAEVMTWSTKLVTALIRDLESIVEGNVADSSSEHWRKRILQVIRDGGPEGVSKTDIARKTQTINKRQRDELLHELIDEMQLVACAIVTTKGREATRFILVEDDGE